MFTVFLDDKVPLIHVIHTINRFIHNINTQDNMLDIKGIVSFIY